MERTINSATGVQTCKYNEDGITCIYRGETKDYRIFFPYGSISKIKMGFFGLDIAGGEHVFFMPASINTKSDLKQMVDFAKTKLKNVPKESVEYTDYIEKKQAFFSQKEKEILFYNACRKAGIQLNENSKRPEILRAKLVAEQNEMMIYENSIVRTYVAGKNAADYFEQYKRYEELADKAILQQKFLPYHGREKEVLIAQETLNYYYSLRDHIEYGRGIPQQSEKSWAVMGGIASAIAGGAAGVAVASDLQRQNAEIRARNEKMRNNYFRAALPTLTHVYEEIKYWEKRVNKAKIALMDDSDPERLFSLIDFCQPEVHMFYDGSLLVTVKAKYPYVRLFDSVTAVIDGSVTAVVSQEGKVIAQVPVVLTREGSLYINRGEYDLIGACTERCADTSKPCTLEFQCRDLWAIEV